MSLLHFLSNYLFLCFILLYCYCNIILFIHLIVVISNLVILRDSLRSKIKIAQTLVWLIHWVCWQEATRADDRSKHVLAISDHLRFSHIELFIFIAIFHFFSRFFLKLIWYDAPQILVCKLNVLHFVLKLIVVVDDTQQVIFYLHFGLFFLVFQLLFFLLVLDFVLQICEELVDLSLAFLVLLFDQFLGLLKRHEFVKWFHACFYQMILVEMVGLVLVLNFNLLLFLVFQNLTFVQNLFGRSTPSFDDFVF